MKLNTDTTTHYRKEMVDIECLKKMVSINEKHLREKPTWYDIESRLQYFKARDDYRIFTELFFGELARTFMNLETVKYQIAYVRTISPEVRKSDEKSECGLLSENFQKKGFNHYLVGELLQPEISNYVAYGGYNLSSLLRFFKDTLDEESYQSCKEFLLKLYMIDAFTFQVDRNPNNIAFQVPKLPDVSYKERLHLNKLMDCSAGRDSLEFDSKKGIYLIKNFTPNVIYDSERCLGIHRNELAYRKGQYWCPPFPYSNELNFSNSDEARNKSKKEFDGLDPNLFSLFIEHQDFCEPYFERLAYDDEYNRVLEEFTYSTSPVRLQDNEIEYFKGIMKDRQTEFQKILKM